MESSSLGLNVVRERVNGEMATTEIRYSSCIPPKYGTGQIKQTCLEEGSGCKESADAAEDIVDRTASPGQPGGGACCFLDAKHVPPSSSPHLQYPEGVSLDQQLVAAHDTDITE